MTLPLMGAQELVTKENSAEFSNTIALIKPLIPEKLISLLSTFQDYLRRTSESCGFVRVSRRLERQLPD